MSGSRERTAMAGLGFTLVALAPLAVRGDVPSDTAVAAVAAVALALVGLARDRGHLNRRARSLAVVAASVAVAVAGGRDPAGGAGHRAGARGPSRGRGPPRDAG